MTLSIWTDGSSDNKYETGPMAGIGAAAVLMNGETPVIAVVAGAPVGTNNVAEMLGVYLAYEELIPKTRRYHCMTHGHVPTSKCPYGSDPAPCLDVATAFGTLWGTDHEVTIFSDSQYVVKGLNDWVPGWVADNWIKKDGVPVMNKEYWLSLMRARVGSFADLAHVKGHAGHRGNEIADRLSYLTRLAYATGTMGPKKPGMATIEAAALNHIQPGQSMHELLKGVSGDLLIQQLTTDWTNSFFSKS